MVKKVRKQNGTCIAVIKLKNGKLMMAADRRASWDFSQAQTMPRPKLQKRNGLILAGTGDGFLCHLIVDILDFEQKAPQTSVDEYLHGPFFNAVRKLLVSKGMADEHKILKIPSEVSASILIACEGKLFLLDIFNPADTDHYPHGLITLDEANTPFATGCGGLLAWGSLLTTVNSLISDGIKLTPKQRLRLALEVAATVSPGCNDVCDFVIED